MPVAGSSNFVFAATPPPIQSSDAVVESHGSKLPEYQFRTLPRNVQLRCLDKTRMLPHASSAWFSPQNTGEVARRSPLIVLRSVRSRAAGDLAESAALACSRTCRMPFSLCALPTDGWRPSLQVLQRVEIYRVGVVTVTGVNVPSGEPALLSRTRNMKLSFDIWCRRRQTLLLAGV